MDEGETAPEERFRAVNSEKTWKRWAERLGRWALATVFLWAAVPKILNPLGFAQDIENYQLLKGPLAILVSPVAVVLPWTEAFVGLALLSGFAADGAILLVVLQLVMFIGALFQAWMRDLDIDCGCFGHGKGGRSVAKALAEDWVFLAVAAWVMVYRLRRSKNQHPVI